MQINPSSRQVLGTWFLREEKNKDNGDGFLTNPPEAFRFVRKLNILVESTPKRCDVEMHWTVPSGSSLQFHPGGKLLEPSYQNSGESGKLPEE